MAKNSKNTSGTAKDERFSASAYDPRFIVPSTKKNKVKVDDRFSKEELKKLNVTATGKKAKVDRYGRKIKEGEDADFEKYFEEEKEASELESEPENELKSASGSELESEADSEDNSEDEDKQEMPTKNKKSVQFKETKSDSALESESEDDDLEEEGGFIDRARGEGLQSDSDSDSDISDSEEEESDSEVEAEESKPEEGEPSATFAVVNLDWDNVRAVDLMSTFASFVPKGGNIKSVTIYPSEFGKEQMQKEETEGPPKDLFKSKKKKKDEDSDSDEELDLTNKEDLEKAARKLYEEDDGEQDYDSKALRRYQLQRLRYYYAVVKCDSVGTAEAIYKNCDGSEYESTANIFDLRYVPDGMDFNDEEAKETCTKIPSSYRPDSSFVTDALQHSKVKLTWDETPKERTSLSTRLFSQKEIDDMDFKAYLASDSDGSEDESSELKNKYKNLLGGRFAEKNAEEDSDGEVDMEITFNPGLSEGAEKAKKEKEEPSEETTIQAYKRKEKERRQKRAEKFKSKTEEDEEDKEATTGKKDKKNKKGKGKKPDAGDEKSKAELELLMLDEDDKKQADHFSMRDIIKAEKSKKNKKKGKKNFDDNLVQDNFQADLDDDRFKEVFENHEFAIDPTNSEFKKTNTMKQILNERGKRLRKGESEGSKKRKVEKKDDGKALNALVNKLKQKN